MSCDECAEQQRSQVAALGAVAVRALEVLLRAPPPGRLENARRQIVESYQPVTAMTQQAYVTLMLDAYVAKAQTRAAISLADIGTPNARAALSRAMAEVESRAYRPDVVRAIAGALSRATNPTFTGTLGPTNVDFGDTVRVHAGSVAWDGSESVILNGSPFGSELLLRRFNTPANDDSLEFVAVGELGSYVLSVTGQGPNDIVQVDTTLRIRSMRYSVHTPATANVLTQAALPQTRYLVLGARGGADTVDYFKVQPTIPIAAKAGARWPGTGDVHLVWRPCSGVPAGTTVTGRVVSPAGTGIGGAQVSIPSRLLGTVTAATGDFSIGGIFPALPGGVVELLVRRMGYSPRMFRVAVGTTGNFFSLLPAGATAATAMSMTSSGVAVPAGACRLLQVWTRPTGKHRIVQLKIAA